MSCSNETESDKHLDRNPLERNGLTPLWSLEIIGRQGLRKLRHSDLSYAWLQAAVRGKLATLKKVQHGRSQDEGAREGQD